MINKVYIDSDGLLQILVVGDQTAASVQEMGDKLRFCIQQLRQEGRPVLILDNLLQMGATPSAVRREVAHLAKTLDFDRAVMVGGGSAAMRLGTNLMLRAVGRSNTRYFASLESARVWLSL